MAQLKIFFNGNLEKTLKLSEGQEYVIGRSSDCDFTVSDQAGVSRQHFKILFDGSQWRVDLLSKFGGLTTHGGEVETIALENGQSFSLHSYEFQFQGAGAPQAAGHEGVPEHSALVPVDAGMAPQGNSSGPEKTVVASFDGLPYLRISNPDGSEDQLRLEGNLWTAGRDNSCEIVIRDRGASRRHFELSMANGKTYVIDLNSANGTLLNGQKILANQPIPVKSGDTISVLSVKIVFELRDPGFEKNLQLIPQPEFEPFGALIPNASAAPQAPEKPKVNTKPMLKDIKNWPNWEVQVKGKTVPLGKHKKAIYAVIGAAFIFTALIVDPAANKKAPKSRLPANVHKDFMNLKEDKKTYIKDTYKLAKNLFLQKNYPLAKKELKEIHDLIPFYKDSRKMEAESKQWIAIAEQQKYLENQRRAAAELERRIEAQVSRCDARMKPTTTQMELSRCLGDAMDLNPDHPGIRRLQAIIEEREEEARRRAERRADYRARVKKGSSLFYRAKKLEDAGKDYHAIRAYNRYLRSKYPDPKRLKSRARRSLASLKENLDFRIESMIKRAQSYFDQSQYREAMKVLKSSEKIHPKSELIKETRKKFMKQITRQMKTIYEDSVLEESLGNVEAAKDKWRKILELSYPGDEYYKKARTKLQKYGGV